MNREETCKKRKYEKSCLKIHHAKEFFIKFLCVVMCCLLNFFLPRDFFRWMMNMQTKADTTNEKGLQGLGILKTAIIQDDSRESFSLMGFFRFLYVNSPSFVRNFIAVRWTKRMKFLLSKAEICVFQLPSFFHPNRLASKWMLPTII